MKYKLGLIAASMSALSLISCPTLAADTQAQVRSVHHHRHIVSETTVVPHCKDQYKDVLPVAEVCPHVDMYDSMLDMMNHNVGRARPTIHCTDPLSLAGGIAFDSTWGSRNRAFSGENTARFSLNDAYINAYGLVNDWTSAFASLSFSNFQPYPGTTTLTGGTGPANSFLMNGVYSNSYVSNALQLEQGYITFKNMNYFPIFLRVGKMFTDFNRYTIHPMSESFTQVMSESLHTTAALGFMTAMGFNGSLYTFDNPMRKMNANGSGVSHNQNNWGGSINFNHPSDQLGFDAGAGYIFDFTGVDQVAYSVNQFNGTSLNPTGFRGTYQNRVDAATLYADLNSGPFEIEARYVTALRRFNIMDMPTRTAAAIAAGGPALAAKPWSVDATAGYAFNSLGKNQNLYISYQASQNAVNMFLPRARWQFGYGLNLLKSVNLGLQWNHDYAYSATWGGTNKTSNAILGRIATQFG